MRPVGAELVERREVLTGQWLASWHVPTIVSGARAGQVVHVRTLEAGGLPLRRPYPIATADPASGTLTIQVPGSGAAGAWVRGVRSIVLLYGAATSGEVYPSSLLPDEVEYVVATADGSLGHRGPVVDLVLEYEAWADQAFAAGSPALLAEMTRLATGRRGRLGVANLGRKRGGGRQVQAGSAEARRKSFLQVGLDQTLGCAAGTCLGCVVPGRDGPVRVCREGPAFAADELDWERAS